MSLVTIVGSCAVFVLAGTALLFAASDLLHIAARKLDQLRVRRVARRGWDWVAFEREIAGYVRGRRLQR